MDLITKLTSTPEGLLSYLQEYSLQSWTELVCQIMEDDGITRAELARRLGRSQGYITKMLDGRFDIKIRMMSNVFTALNKVMRFESVSIGDEISGIGIK